jgi:hypothetical protein
MAYEVNKKLLSDYKINFENINIININIIRELEKRMAFSEECAKILLNQNGNAPDFSFFISLLENEKSKINFSNVKKNIIDENVLLCKYIFKSINFSDLVSAYSVYIAANPVDLDNFDLTKNINLTINLTEKFTFNDFIQYTSLFDFNIINLNYDGINNSVSLTLKLTELGDKESIFAVFYGLLGYFCEIKFL